MRLIASMDSLIACKGLRHAYGRKQVLHGLTFSVESGGIFGLLGKNGAGKSTAINILMGFLRPSGGTCRVLGEESHALSPEVRSRIGLLQEGFVQYDFMRVAELERYYAPFYPGWNREVFYDLIGRMQMPDTRRLSAMSNGQRSQVVLGLIMAQMPELMILDDYSMGLDVGYRRLFVDFLREYVTLHGTTVLLTSHVVQELDRVIDRMVVLKEGRVCACMGKREFMDSFGCCSFRRTPASLAMKSDDTVRSIEHTAKTTFVYGFFSEQEIAAYLERHQVLASGLVSVPMSFEDAFVGLTGKY
ncbi:MAG: ABC transporter ATP-binding protein [Chlorobiaceae bacterium]|jgi:ABC-2 type transport system ATP-binding protein|nr:ABC transporter ATP-binding protein [Chlorobiaceae bacterium]